ncbi:hypothetical protein [Actinophytocola gossypii]|uniref:Uncharacterized protein n=1 Tax=Actinophytocola gossypii TaxID=2812003 RepID=A0ABT2JFR1_9PSEU|nr:hypothetical protein [Actinophytocola gossypii]MCT2586715.1 hypothetical protein [Actinophytocola gossypii]
MSGEVAASGGLEHGERQPGRELRINDELIAAGHAAGTLRPEFTSDDLHALVHDNALALKYGARPDRAGYDRRTTYLLDGLRGR